jgi:hypothetical protein
MRLSAPLLATAIFASPLHAQQAGAASDARAVMRTVLAFETGVHRAAEVGPPPCVRPRVGRASLGGSRRDVEEAEAYERLRPPSTPVRPEALVRVDPVTAVDPREIRLSPFHRWQRIPSRNPGYVGAGGPLPAGLEAEVKAAERAALVAPLQPRWLSTIRPEWFDRPLSMCRNRRALPALEFDSPVVVNGFAFVRTDFDCVLCGQGIVLALRRVGEAWEIIAAAHTWRS